MIIKLTKFIDQESCIIGDSVPNDVYLAASRTATNIVNAPLNSEQGLMVTYDKPTGCDRYITNFQRPAVLRQYFGKINGKGKEICTYGNGTGSSTVGTHPDHVITRVMPPDLVKVADHIFAVVKSLNLSGMTVEPFNHCTVLFYFHKSRRSSNAMLGFHTDNVYSMKGLFIPAYNTQKENTPTCILTVGTQRELHFQKQFNHINPKTKRRKWKEFFRRKIFLEDRSVFVLHPKDECPQNSGIFKVRWRHGVPSFEDTSSVSLAFVFRTVVTSASQDNRKVGPERDMLFDPPDLACCYSIHERLKHLASKTIATW